ncbi:MAG: hypothetical protein ACK4G1_01115 [Ignavibacteria bacterium]
MNSARKILASLLILIYTIVINGNLLSLAEYLIRYDYIVKNICVQKNQINNSCKGSCHLRENLKKVDEQHTTNTKSVEFRLLLNLDLHTTNKINLSDIINDVYEQIILNDHRVKSQAIIKPDTPPPKFFLQ